VNVIKWLEMPVAYSSSTGGSVGTKYPIAGNAVVLYKNDRAYVGLRQPDTAAALATHPDVYPVSPTEVYLSDAVSLRSVEHLVRRTSGSGHSLARTAGRIGLGDAVSAVARGLGLSECRGCARRRHVLNRFTTRRRWQRSIRSART
jgi:hypothetical protein